MSSADLIQSQNPSSCKHKRYRAKHKERLIAKRKLQWQDPKFRADSQSRKREWYASKREDIEFKASEVARVRLWVEENKERRKAYSRRWHQENKDKKQAYRRNRRSRKKSSGGSFTPKDIEIIFKAQRGKCAYCRKSLKCGYHIDHIVALINGGTNWPSNLQLCCETCNKRKNDSDPVTFARRMGYLL